MYAPFARSYYYGASAPPRDHQPATGLPPLPAWKNGAGAVSDGSHVPCVPIGQDGCPALPRQFHRAYAAVLRPATGPEDLSGSGVGGPHVGQPRTASRPRSTRLEPVQRLRSLNRRFLTYTLWCLRRRLRSWPGGLGARRTAAPRRRRCRALHNVGCSWGPKCAGAPVRDRRRLDAGGGA